MNGPTIAEVDAAVRAVLAGQSARAIPQGDPIFAGRLLRLADAEGLAGRGRVVRVAPGTVVTPLARDHLKRHGVELRFVSQGEVNRLRNPGEWGFAIEVESGVLAA